MPCSWTNQIVLNDLIKNFLQQAVDHSSGTAPWKTKSFRCRGIFRRHSRFSLRAKATPDRSPDKPMHPYGGNPHADSGTGRYRHTRFHDSHAYFFSGRGPHFFSHEYRLRRRSHRLLPRLPFKPSSKLPLESKGFDRSFSNGAAVLDDPAVANLEQPSGAGRPRPRSRRRQSLNPAPAAPPRRHRTKNPIESHFFTTSDHVKLHYLEAGRGLAPGVYSRLAPPG